VDVNRNASRYVDAFDIFPWPLTQGARWDLEQTGESFMPRIDIHEDKEAIHVDVELAGIPKEKIHVRSLDSLCLSLR
jgi:HSP20 family molecular chaperone IbpA